LSLELLRARTVHPPFVFERLSDAPVLLVVENHHTFASFSSELGPESGVGVLAYGAGSAFVGSVAYAAELPGRRVDEIRYFGVWDAKGLRIPADADRARGAGLPHVRPAGWLYQRLLEVGVPAPAPAVPADVARQLAEWLPPAVRDRAAALLASGR